MSRIFPFSADYLAGPRKRVAVLLPLASACARDCQDGILRYSNAVGNWNILLLPQAHPARRWKLLKDFRPHGLITHADAYPLLIHKGLDPQLPTVLLGRGGTGGDTPHPHILLNGRDIAQAAAHFIARKPVGNLACIGTGAEDGSTAAEIYKNLRHALAALRPDLASRHLFLRGAGDGADRTSGLKGVGKFLKSLPTPCLVFALSDWLAWHTVMLCRELGLDVPRQIMVLGLNDNPSLCLAATPQITALAPDYNGAGYLAGKILARLFWTDGRSVRGRTFTFGLPALIERDSTLDPRGTSRIIQRAKEFIRLNFTRPLTVEDVAKALQTSKRTLNLHFARSTDRSVRAAIRAERLNRLLHLLTRTDISIRAATEQSGFTSENRAKTIFRERFGITMTEYRTNPAIRNNIETLRLNQQIRTCRR
ncbi:MAG: substrate-binding domain-containing protein [Kiritimatiellia bacterium]